MKVPKLKHGDVVEYIPSEKFVDACVAADDDGRFTDGPWWMAGGTYDGPAPLIGHNVHRIIDQAGDPQFLRRLCIRHAGTIPAGGSK